MFFKSIILSSINYIYQFNYSYQFEKDSNIIYNSQINNNNIHYKYRSFSNMLKYFLTVIISVLLFKIS